MGSGQLNRSARICLTVVGFASALFTQAATPAMAAVTIGYLPAPTASNLTKCAGEKPWPVQIDPQLNTNTTPHTVSETISISKPDSPCAATYYVHFVSVTDQSNGLADTHYNQGGTSASQTVAYPATRVGSITFEVATGNQGNIDCQFWYYVANAETQPAFTGTSKGAGAEC